MNHNNARKKMQIGMGILCLFMIGFSGTYAYLSDQSARRNSMTIGKNTIRIEEKFDPPEELKPGENRYQKQVTIRNTGLVPCYVRALVEFSDKETADRSCMRVGDGEWFPPEKFKENTCETWIYISEEEDDLLGGYYYYQEILPVEKETCPLIDEIRTIYENAEDIEPYEILVYGESVQISDLNGELFTGENAWKEAWIEFLERRGIS